MKINKNLYLVLPGFPGRSNRGFCGWCSVTLITYPVLILFDTGFYTDRGVLLNNLRNIGYSPEQIEVVVLSHLHYDHCLNASLFPNAEFIVSVGEVKYALSEQGYSKNDVNVIDSVQYFLDNLNVRQVKGGEIITKGISTLLTPGHTPGGLSLCVKEEHENRNIVIAGDAIKNAREAILGEASMVFGSKEEARQSIHEVLALGDLIIPGHDRPFTFDSKHGVKYIMGYDVEFDVNINPERDSERIRISLPKEY